MARLHSRLLARCLMALALSAGVGAWAADPAPLPSLPSGGTVRSLAADPFQPGRVLLGTTTGVVYASSDAGAQWNFFARIAAHDDWVVSDLFADPSVRQRWYASLWSWSGRGGGVYVSSDGGKDWQPLLQDHSVRALALAPSDPKTLVAATLEGVYRTQDGGQHWNLISPPHDRELTNIESVAIDPTNAQEIYVGTWHLPWKTVNGGHDWWQMRQGVIDDSDVFSIAVDRQTPSTVYLSACSGIYRSDNHGNLFRKIQGIPYSARRTPALVQDPADPATIYAGTTQGLWVTHDGGAAWARITAPSVSVNAVLLLPGAPSQPSRILLGTQFAGVYASSDGGKTFTLANQGFANRQVSDVATGNDGTYLAVTGDQNWGGIFFRPDAEAGAASWQQIPPPLPNQDVYSLHWSPVGLLAATSRGVYLHAPAAAPPARRRGVPASAWQLVRTAPRDHVYALSSPAPGSPVVLAATQSGLYRTEDGGRTWVWMREAPAPLYRVLALPARADSGDGGGWLLVAGDDYVLRSSDQGQHFLPGRLALPGRVDQLAAAPLPDGSTLLLAATTRGLYQSRDHGATWTVSGHGLPAVAMGTIHVQSDGLYVATATVGETYRSSDGGVHWQRFALLPQIEVLARAAPGLDVTWQAHAVSNLALASDH